MTSISKDYYLNTSKVKYTTEKDNSALGKDAFLQILITQLQNQDPTSPMDDKEFIAQMAQFSSLEQMQNMTSAMTKLLESQQQTQMMSYSTFVGKEIKWHNITSKLDGKGQPIVEQGTGVITELMFKNGEPVFKLDSGKEITPGNISSIVANANGQGAAAENPFAQASQLIGKTIQYTNNNEQIQAIIEAITNKNGMIEYVLNNGSRITREQFSLVNELEENKDEGDSVEQTE